MKPLGINRWLAATAVVLTLSGAKISALELELIGRYGQTKGELFDESAAEIPAYDAETKRVFVTNAATASIDIIDISGLGEDPSTEPGLIASIPLEENGVISGPTSVVVTNGVLAVALAADPETDPGYVAFFDADGNPVDVGGVPVAKRVEVGVLPDAIAVSPDGNMLVTSNEGQPNDENTIDPVGSVSVIDISSGVSSASVTTVGFESFDIHELRAAGVRIFGQLFVDTGNVDEDGEKIFDFVGPTTVAQDIEPEYAAISEDSTTAYVTLQENNALAIIDLVGPEAPKVTGIVPLGLKDHFVTSYGLDPSNRDDFVGKIRRHKVLGMFQPDAIAAYEVDGDTYLVTANEGDSRDYDNFSEEIRADELPDEGFAFKGGNGLIKNDRMLGRLKTTTAPPDTAILGTDKKGNQILDKVVAYGSRSFSIWAAATGELVYDSGDEFEQITLATVPDIFNATNDDPEADDRSDDKGPEPEGVIVAEFEGVPYAFITLERIGGVMVYDVSNPSNAVFVDYATTRLFADDVSASTIDDDLGPEGLVFIEPADSPTGEALLVVTNEVSGSTLVFAVR